MIREYYLKQSLLTGDISEAEPASDDAELERLGIALRRRIEARLGCRLAIRQVNDGSSSDCELEIHSLNNPYHDVECFGVHYAGSPRSPINLLRGLLGALNR